MSSQPVSIHLLCQLLKNYPAGSERIPVNKLISVNRTSVYRTVLNNLDVKWTNEQWDLYVKDEHTEQLVDPPRLWNLLHRWMKVALEQNNGYILSLDCGSVLMTPEIVSNLLNDAIISYKNKTLSDTDIEFLQQAYSWLVRSTEEGGRIISRDSKEIVRNLVGFFYGKKKKDQRAKIKLLEKELNEARTELTRLESETEYWKAKLFPGARNK